MIDDFIPELFDSLWNEFNSHLSISENRRVLFSGKFGMGKTYFLQHFFDKDIQERIFTTSKYNTFHLFPVNYSIASNEDIYRYVKYDILLSMLKNEDIEVQYNDLTFSDTIFSFLTAKPLDVLSAILSMIPKVSSDTFLEPGKLHNVTDKIIKLKKDFKQYHKAKTKDEDDELIEFIHKINNKEGSLYEDDAVVKIISKVLHRLKVETNRENVLVIDDLDRIDPEHIFRLLNVFAAHIDTSDNQPNKFGFDIIIVVCDINNIKNIFSAKYGQETDFSGYIDKFYSKEVFHFENSEAFDNIAYTALQNISFKNQDNQASKFFLSLVTDKHSIAIDLFDSLIKAGLINLRTLIINSKFQNVINPYKRYYFGESIDVDTIKFPLLIHFDIIQKIVGGYEQLLMLTKKLKSNDLKGEYLHNKTAQLIYLLTSSKHEFDHSKKTTEITINEKNFLLELQRNELGFNKNNVRIKENEIIGSEPYYFTLKDTLDILLTFVERLILISKVT